MSKHYTQEEIEEIRLAFSGAHGNGLIHEIVLSEIQKGESQNADPQKLSDFFSSVDGDGVARLINAIELSPDGVPCDFASHCIDFYGVTSGPFSLENAATLVGIKIGDCGKQISPYQWLSYLAQGFDKLSQIQKTAFNEVCKDFAKVFEYTAKKEVENDFFF